MDSRSKMMITFLVTSGFFRDDEEVLREAQSRFSGSSQSLYSLYKDCRNVGHQKALAARQIFVEENPDAYSQIAATQLTSTNHD